jgi:DNA-binding FadR family transcriptional regulator
MSAPSTSIAAETDPRTSDDVHAVFSTIAGRAGQTDELKSNRIVAAIEREILSGKLAPGVRLPTESELCDTLNVSRSVVRDAVRTLTARGLVEVRQGRGTTVAQPSDEAFGIALVGLLSRSGLTMGEVVQARAAVEISLARIAATTGTSDDWDTLDTTFKQFADAVTRRNDDTARDAHLGFHKAILAAVHQPALELMLKPITEIILVSSNASLVRSSPDDWELDVHAPIITALRAGDPDAAERAMRTHFEVSTRPEPYREFLDRSFSTAYFGLA